MAVFEIKCPHCGGSLEVQDEWVDMETSCPVCGKAFVIPRQSAPAETKHRSPVLKLPKSARKPAAQTGGEAPTAAISSPDIPVSDRELQDLEEEDLTENKEIIRNIVKWSIRIVLLIAIAIGGYLIYKKLTAPSPKSLKGNQLYLETKWRKKADNEPDYGDIVAHDLFPEIKSQKEFFYRDAKFMKIHIREYSGQNSTKEAGTVTFMREVGGKEKLMERPIEVVVDGMVIRCRFPFIYANHPDYLEEDGDLLLALAAQIDSRLRDCEYVSGRAEGNGVLECTVSKAGIEKQVRLKAEQVDPSNGILRVWVEVLSVK